MLNLLLNLMPMQVIPVNYSKCTLAIKTCDEGRVHSFQFSYNNNDLEVSASFKYDKFFTKNLRDYYIENILTKQCWNRINFIFNNDKTYELRVFWDEEYFVEMHNTSYQEYYKDML